MLCYYYLRRPSVPPSARRPQSVRRPSLLPPPCAAAVCLSALAPQLLFVCRRSRRAADPSLVPCPIGRSVRRSVGRSGSSLFVAAVRGDGDGRRGDFIPKCCSASRPRSPKNIVQGDADEAKSRRFRYNETLDVFFFVPNFFLPTPMHAIHINGHSLTAQSRLSGRATPRRQQRSEGGPTESALRRQPRCHARPSHHGEEQQKEERKSDGERAREGGREGAREPHPPPPPNPKPITPGLSSSSP